MRREPLLCGVSLPAGEGTSLPFRHPHPEDATLFLRDYFESCVMSSPSSLSLSLSLALRLHLLQRLRHASQVLPVDFQRPLLEYNF